MNISKLLKNKTLIGVVLALVGAAIIYFSGCEGTGGKLTDLIKSNTEKVDNSEVEELKTTINLQTKELNSRNEKLGQALQSIQDLTNDLTYCDMQKKGCDTIRLSDPLLRDTCFNFSTKTAAQRQDSIRNSKYIEALLMQVQAHKVSIQNERKKLASIQRELIGLRKHLNTLSEISPLFAEKVKLINVEGLYQFQFEAVQPKNKEAEEIINNLSVKSSRIPYYNWSIFSSVNLINEAGIDPTYQAIGLGAMYRPKFFKGHVGIGAQGLYGSPSFKRFSPEGEVIGLSIMLEYNFRTNK